MFDWNEENDGVTDTIWVGFEEEENHTVPYPKPGENGALTVGGSCKNKQDNERRNTTGAYIEKIIFDPKNELDGCNLDPHSRFHAEEKSSGSGYHLGSCSSFPFIDSAVVNVENDHDSTSSTMVNDPSFDYSKSSSFTEICQSGDLPPSYEELHGFGELKLDSKPSIFSSEHGKKEVDSFLDCDWGSIQDFDDLDELFSNSGPIFGHETSNVDELLSPADSTNTMTSTFTMHEPLISVDVPSEKGSSFLETEKSLGKRKRLNCDMVADHTVVAKETECHPEITRGHYQTVVLDMNNLDEKKTLLKPHIEVEEKMAVNVGKSTVLDNRQVQQFDTYAPPAVLQSFQSLVLPPQVQMGGPHFLGQQTFTGYGYPACSFPSIPLLPSPVQATSQQSQPAQLCNVHPQNHARHISSLQIPNVASRMPTMSPEEKIEKLRWRQQMQAMLAIKQQGKQFWEHVGTADAPLNPRISQNSQNRKSCLSSSSKVEEKGKDILLSELNMPVEQEESHFTNVTSKCTLQETMFREFQETLMKLDDNLRVCIKESLYRLARNASERHYAKNRSNAHFSITREDDIFKNEAISVLNRSSAAIDVETNTNPIDRAVANLLFHSPQNSSVLVFKEDNPESKESISWECISQVNTKCGKIKGNGTLKIS